MQIRDLFRQLFCFAVNHPPSAFIGVRNADRKRPAYLASFAAGRRSANHGSVLFVAADKRDHRRNREDT
jgi:hypothetical protein